MAGKSPINIFDINNQNTDPLAPYYNITSGDSVGNSRVNSQQYTRQMEEIDNMLQEEGLIIERLDDQEKWNYVNSLTEKEYERMTQYKNAGYSFGASKALLDLERQQNGTNGMGGLRGQAFQLNEPLGGKNSVWNRLNFIGRGTEEMDDYIQSEFVPSITVDLNNERRGELLKQFNALTEEDKRKWEVQFLNEPEWRQKLYEIGDGEYDMMKYWEMKNTSRVDSLLGVHLDRDDPTLFNMIANIPASAISNASAITRGVTNPTDTMAMLLKLVGTQEGRDIIYNRYFTLEGLRNAIETDPVGVASDFMDMASLVTKPAVRGARGTSIAQRTLGMTKQAEQTSRFADKLSKFSNNLGGAADLGISYGYDKLLDSTLSKLGQGNKLSQGVGAYLSMTQRPLQTIWKGASPDNTNTILPGISSKAEKIWNNMKDRIQTSATGLTPEVRERIRQNPYIKEYWERVEQMLQDEGAPMDNQKIMEESIEEVGQELLRRLEEYENRLETDGAEYQKLRSTTVPFDFSDFMGGVYNVFTKNGITVNPDGTLSFSRTANPADMNPIITAWNVIRNMEPKFQNMTLNQFLDFRQQLRSLIKYQSDAPSTKYSKGIIRQLVDGELNNLAHKKIPELAKVDKIYSNEINELKEFKDGLVYQVGEKKGQIKDNFYSIISTLNTQNRQKMKARIEKLFPGIGERVEAIRMLPTIAKAVQTSPQMMKALFQKAGFLGGIKMSGGIKKAVMGWLIGIVADELFAKPLGKKWREEAINELINEVSPEAIQKLAEIKSKVDAGVELSEQEKVDLQVAMQELAQREYQYLDEQHKKEFDQIMQSANNTQPKLPGTMDTIGPDGIIRLQPGKQVNNPETYNPSPRNRSENIKRMQEELGIDEETAVGVTDGIDEFLDEVGANIEGEINTRGVNYDRFSTKSLEKLMDDPDIPQSEKNKIADILVKRGTDVDDRTNLDQEFAYRINKLNEEEKRVGKVGKNKVDRSIAKEQQNKLEKKKDALKVEMRERYAGQEVDLDQNWAEEKYAELEGKSIDYINSYKKSKQFKDQKAEEQVLNQVKEEWKKQPQFIRDMDDNMASRREEIVNKDLNDGYEWRKTDVGDRFINTKTGEYGAIKYKKDGTIEAVFPDNEDLFKNSGVIEILPPDADIRFSGEPDTMKVGDRRGDDYEYQTVGRANPNEKTITAEEGLNLKSFKGDKTIGELADEYGLKKQIVEKIFTAEGEEALGRAKGDLIELVKEIKEGTAPHEVFHPIFNMVNSKRRAEIIDLVKKHKGMSEAEAKEWLADSFSEYFRTGKFDTKPIPEGFVNKVKWFFNKVKEFINGTWKDRKKIQKLFDDIMEGKIERESIKDEGYEYQLKNDEIYERAYKEKSKKLARLLTNKSYSEVALEDAMVHTYDPDFDTWLNKINTYLEENRNASIRSMLNRRELVDAYSIMQEYGSDGVMDFYKTAERINSEDGNKRMSDTYELLKKMKENPLKIPDDIKYEPQTYELRQALYDIETPLNYLVESYDPDPLEWINEIRKTGHILSREVPKYEELVKIQNLLDKFIESGGKKIEGTFNDKMINKLVEKRINKNSRLGSTFDEKAIREIGGDIESTIQNRINDFTGYRHRANGRGSNMPDEAVGDFVYALGNSYDPNIDIWKKNMEKELKKMFPNYNPDEKPLIWEHQYQTLKSRIEQLGKYDNTDYQMLREDDMSGIFMEGVNDKKTQQIADKSEKATQDLVAVSGFSINNFEKQIKGLEGKSPMPSIGITDPNVPHENRGELTLVFGKDTVDPKVNPENVIYGSDAYTPMFPSTRTKGGLDLDDMHRIANKINDKYLGSDVGVRELIVDWIKDLKDLDITDNEAWESEYIRFQSRFEQQVNSILEERMDEGVTPIELEDREIHEIWEDIITPILENQPKTVIEGSNFKDSQKGFDEDTVRWYVHQLDVEGLIPEDTMQNLGGEDAIVFDIIETGTEDGVDGILNVFENYNIEPGDPQSREIAQAIYNSAKSQDRPYTAENALEAMKSQPETNRSTRPGSFRDMIGAEGTKIWLEDVRNKNFGKMVHDEYLGNIEYLENRYDQIVSIIGDEYMGGYPDDGLFHHGEHDEEVREMIKEAYDTDIEKFKDNLRDISKPDGTVEKLKLPDEMLQRIVDLVEQGKKVPVRFSESKPQRVVDLYEEVKYVLVPERDVERVNKMVEGTPLEGKVEGYKPDDYSAPRSKKIKELQKKYGNIFFSFGGAVMPIAMLLMMAQGGDDQGEGQQA